VAGPPVGAYDAFFEAIEVLATQPIDERVPLPGLDRLILLAVLAGPALYGLGLGPDGLLGNQHGLDHDVLRHLVGACLDHRYGLPGPSHDEVEVALIELLVGRVQDETPIGVPPDAHGPDRAVVGYVRQC
jgi:hypothetical protein